MFFLYFLVFFFPGKLEIAPGKPVIGYEGASQLLDMKGQARIQFFVEPWEENEIFFI